MRQLSLDPCWLVLAGSAETQPALCAIWSETSSNLLQQKELSRAALNIKRSVADEQIKELSLIGKIFSFPPVEESEHFCRLARSHLQNLPVLFGKRCPNLIVLAIYCFEILLYKMVFAELLLKSQLKELTGSSLYCPTKHNVWKKDSSWQMELESAYSQAPEPFLPASREAFQSVSDFGTGNVIFGSA